MSTAQPTVVPSTAPGIDGWRQRLRDRAQLAGLGFGGSASLASQHSAVRHLAFLPAEALELDLDDPAQRQFGAYELRAKLGQGGMGVVYRAYQPALDREVAIKLLAAGPWASAEFIARFQREAQHAARLNHPNIVPIHEIGVHEELNFFSMALVRGQTLARRIADQGPLPPRNAAALLLTVAEALDYAHRLDVLHLDLKPGNVLLDERGVPMVADFGLARRLDQSLAADSNEVSGTPSYMAPEQATLKSHKLSPATDVYGLGAILYEMLAGRPPFLGATPQETLQRVVAEEPEPLRKIVPNVPADLAAIADKCLAKHPKDRYPSARELADDLRRFIEGRPVSVRPLTAAQRIVRAARREPRIAALVALLAVALIGGLVATSVQWRAAESGRAQSRAMLWGQRSEAAFRYLDQRQPFAALPLLAANVAEAEGAGVVDEAQRGRERIGSLLANAPQLIAAHRIDASIRAVAIAPGGDTIAIGTSDAQSSGASAQVRLIDRTTGQERWRRPLLGLSHLMADGDPHADQMRFTADGTRLLVYRALVKVLPKPHGADSVLLDAATGEALMPPAGVFADFRDANFSPDGKFVVLRDNSGHGQTFRVDGWQPLGARTQIGGSAILALGPGGRYAVSGGSTTNAVLLYSLPDLELVMTAPTSAGPTAWDFDPTGNTALVGLSNGQVMVLDCESRSLQALDPSPGEWIVAARFTAGGRVAIAASEDGSVMQWTLPAGTPRAKAIREARPVWGLAVDDAGDWLATTLEHEWDLGGESVVGVWRVSATDRDQATAVSIGQISTGDTGRRQPAGLDGTSGLVAVGTMAGTLSVWRVAVDPLRAFHAAPLLDSSLAFDGRRLLAVEGRSIRVVDAVDGKALAPEIVLPQPVGFAALATTPDAVVATAGRWLHRFGASDGGPLGTPVELANSPQRLAVSPDGRIAVLTWLDYRDDHLREFIAAFDVASGRALADPIDLPGPLFGLAFDSNGGRLLAWRNTTVDVFDLPAMRPAYAPIRFQDRTAAESDAISSTARTSIKWAALIDIVAGFDLLVTTRVVEYADGSKDGSLCRARLVDGVILECTKLASEWNRLAASADGQRIAMSTGRVLRPNGTHTTFGTTVATGTDAVAISADGRRIARVVRGGIELFDGDSGERLSALLSAPLAAGDQIALLSFSPDGARIAGRTLGGRWQVWDAPVERRPIADVETLAGLSKRTETDRTLSPQTAGLLVDGDPGAPIRVPPATVDAARWIDGRPVSPRSADAPEGTLDLTGYYNIALGAPDLQDNHLVVGAMLRPDGVHRLLGIDYDLRGAIELTNNPLSRQRGSPPSVKVALPGRSLRAVRVLAAALSSRQDRQSLPYLNLTLHYRRGSSTRQPFLFNRDLPFFWADDDDPLGANGPPWTAWLNYPSHHFDYMAHPRTLVELHMENPHPELAVEAIELEAEAVMWPRPWILAVTVEPVAGESVVDTPTD